MNLVLDRNDAAGFEIYGIHSGIHRIVSAGAVEFRRDEGEITEQEVKRLGQEVEHWLSERSLHPVTVLLETISELYVKGADVKWEELYKEQSVSKIPLPSYKFEPNVCWLDWKSYSNSDQTATFNPGLYRTRWVTAASATPFTSIGRSRRLRTKSFWYCEKIMMWKASNWKWQCAIRGARWFRNSRRGQGSHRRYSGIHGSNVRRAIRSTCRCPFD